MRGPEKSKYLADVLKSVANSEEKLRKVEFELRNRVCDYYTQNEGITFDLKPIDPGSSDHNREGILQIYKPEFEDKGTSSNLKTITSDGKDKQNKQIHEPDKSNVSGEFSHPDNVKISQIHQQELVNRKILGILEPVDLIPEKDERNVQTYETKFETQNIASNSKEIDLIPSHENDEKNIQVYRQEFERNQVICNLKPISPSREKGEKVSQIIEPDVNKNEISNNSMKLLVDKIHSAVESRLRQCLEPYRSRKQRGPFTINKVQRVPEKDLKSDANKNSSGDCIQKENNENGGMAFVEKLFASYYQKERKVEADKEMNNETKVSDNGRKLSRILDKIASKGLEKVLQCNKSDNLTDELKMKNTQFDDKIDRENEARIETKAENRSGLKRELKNRRMKCKKFENRMPTISEKGESSYKNKRGENRHREKEKHNYKTETKEFVEKLESPYKHGGKGKKHSFKAKNIKTKIIGKSIDTNKKSKRSPYLMSFGMRKRKKLGEPIRKRVIKKGDKKKKMNKIINDEQEDSKIVCVSMKNQDECDNESEKQNNNEMFEIVKELVFRNKIQKVKAKKMKKKRKEKVKEGEEKYEKKVRRKKIDKPVWLVPDGHPDGFQPPKTKHRMSSHKLEFENFSDDDKPIRNNFSNDRFNSRKEFVIFLGDKHNNIFGTRSAFKMPLKN